MSHAFGHPPQWDHQLPKMNDMLAPIPPPATRAGPASPILPPPNKNPGVPHHVGTQSLAQYRSPWAVERVSQGRRQDDLYAQSPVAHPLSHQVRDYDHITYGAAPERRLSYPLYSYSHTPIQRQEQRPPHSTFPPFGPVGNFAADGDSVRRPIHQPHDQRMSEGAPSTTPVEQSSRSRQATEMNTDSPWGFTKAGKARKRLEQACVSCRKKKTKCEPMSSSSKCLPCEKNGSECHFDSA